MNIMDGSTQYEVFRAQTENVRELNMAWKQVKEKQRGRVLNIEHFHVREEGRLF